MIKNLDAIAQSKGYQIELEPEYLHIHGIGSFRLPLWMAAIRIFISPKGRRYPVEAFAFKLQRKADRARTNLIIAQQERNLQSQETRNEQSIKRYYEQRNQFKTKNQF